MTKYILKRLGLAAMCFFIIQTIIFVLFKLLPNPVPEVPGGFAKALREMHEAWGYNKPIMVQYGIFLRKVLLSWDWGFCTTVGTFLQPVGDYIRNKLPATVYINFFSIIISLPIGIYFGIRAAVYKNTWRDHVIQFFTMLLISIPSFVFAWLIQYFIGFKLNLVPLIFKGGNDYFSWAMFKSAILPILALSFGSIASYMRLVRAELADSLTSEYMQLAITKGLTRKQATVRHALRNSFVPLMPTILSSFISIMGGSFIIEQIFAVPGIGQTTLNAFNMRDYSVFIACVMFYTVIGLLAGIVSDLSYGLIDPRIRMGGNKNNEL